MDNLTPELVEAAQGVWTQVYSFLRIMLLPFRLWQLAAILGLMAVAHLGRNGLAPRLNLWLRQRQNWPKWRLRLGILIQRKLRVILFALLSWAVVLVMREVTWPSRSQLIALAAALSTAWVAIEFAVRVIANRTFRGWAWWGLWIWVTLHYLDLTQSVGRVLESIALSIGDYRLSMLGVLKAVALTALLIVVGRLLSRLVAGRMARNADLTPTMRVLVAKLLQIALLVIAVVIGLRALGLDLTGLTVFSGAIGLGIGFGLQKVVSNLISGVIILLDESIKPGDVISLGETFGWIDALGARYVSVVTRDGKEYLIPNEDLVTGQVVNWSHTNDFVRLDLEFRCSYGDDPHEVSKVAINAAMTVKRVLAQRTPVCWVTEFGDFSVRYLLRFWISDPAGGLANIRGAVYLALWDAFKKKGITIPLPQREIRIVTDPPVAPPEINDPEAPPAPERT